VLDLSALSRRKSLYYFDIPYAALRVPEVEAPHLPGRVTRVARLSPLSRFYSRDQVEPREEQREAHEITGGQRLLEQEHGD
jgi:hypothetical protein